MATHSSVLAWRIPGMGQPGGLPSMGSHRVSEVIDISPGNVFFFLFVKSSFIDKMEFRISY